MPIPVTCGCGRKFVVRDEHAGKRATCPVCKQLVYVSPSSLTPSAASEPPPLPKDGRNELGIGLRLKLMLAIAGGVVFLATVVVVALVVFRSGSPSDALKATFLNANEGKYSDANNGLSAHIRAIQDQTGMMKQLWDDVTRKGTIARIEILNEQTRGEGAVVRYRIHYKHGRPYEGEEELIKEGGRWKFASINYLGAGMKLEVPMQKSPAIR